jgi:hypothetical protein
MHVHNRCSVVLKNNKVVKAQIKCLYVIVEILSLESNIYFTDLKSHALATQFFLSSFIVSMIRVTGWSGSYMAWI